jgi:hypothetical protein
LRFPVDFPGLSFVHTACVSFFQNLSFLIAKKDWLFHQKTSIVSRSTFLLSGNFFLSIDVAFLLNRFPFHSAATFTQNFLLPSLLVPTFPSTVCSSLAQFT